MTVHYSKNPIEPRGTSPFKKDKGKRPRKLPVHQEALSTQTKLGRNLLRQTSKAEKRREGPASFPPSDSDAEHIGRLPLGPDQAEELRSLLISRRENIGKSVRAITESEAQLEEAEHQSPELVELGTDRGMEKTLLKERDRELAELDEIDVALDRMKQGTYGICRSCGDRIAFRRLLALPEARCCIRCERKKQP